MMELDRVIKHLKAEKRMVEPDQDAVVALFRDEDALGISLLYYEIYGDSFPVEHVYDPDQVKQRNHTDGQHTLVARTTKGDIVGMAGLFCHAPNQNVYEAGQLMLMKSYRHTRVAAKINQSILEKLPETLGVSAIFVEAVCNHPVSQAMAHKQGLHATGLEIECMPARVYSKEGGVVRNVSLLLMFKVFKDNGASVYLPQPYAEFMTRLYGQLGLERKNLAGEALAGTTDSDDFLLPNAGIARITIKKAGNDFNRVIQDLEARAGKQSLVQVYLNLGDHACPRAVDLLREKGYFWGGLLPLWFQSDGLIMQKLPGEPDWEGLHLHNKEAEAMLGFLRSDYGTVTGPGRPGKAEEMVTALKF
ncbi:GNAT family N-acetyltransferase [Desulforapulum autotrophicum]|nr:GNAT family N-acetyltransferase [Desulforapulum autotrophicum]